MEKRRAKYPVLILIISACLLYTLSAIAQEEYVYVRSIPEEVLGLRSPRGIAIDNSENVYVADSQNNCIKEFDSNGNLIKKWGSYGSSDGLFSSPDGIAVDSSGNVYVADSGNNRIQKFDTNGRFITKWGAPGTGDIGLIVPSGIALSNTGYVYVADFGNYCIKIYRPAPDSTQSCVKGDVNGDGNVRSNDAILALRMSAGLMSPTPEQQCAADMNGDGNIRANDAILILRKVAGLGAPDRQISGNKTVAIALDEAHGVAGESITVPIRVDNIDILAGGDIRVAYDSSVLQAVDVVSYSGMELVSNVTRPGLAHIAFASVDKLSSNILFRIKFNILADQTSPLEIQTAELYDIRAFPVKLAKIEGRFSSLAIAPKENALLQNFPNPFNPETWIPYQLKEGSEVTIRIYDVGGELVRELMLGRKSSGLYLSRDRAAYWDGKNEAGEQVASGVYFYNIQAGEYIATKKMIMRK